MVFEPIFSDNISSIADRQRKCKSQNRGQQGAYSYRCSQLSVCCQWLPGSCPESVNSPCKTFEEAHLHHAWFVLSWVMEMFSGLSFSETKWGTIGRNPVWKIFLKNFHLNQLRSLMYFSANQEEHLFNTFLE